MNNLTKKQIGVILGLPTDVLLWTTSQWNEVYNYAEL